MSGIKGVRAYADLRQVKNNAFQMIDKTKKALKAAGFSADDIDNFEFEATAAVTNERILDTCRKWASVDA